MPRARGTPPFAVPRQTSAPPTDELGVVLQGTLSPAGMAPWTQFIDSMEYVPELKWPQSVWVFNQMQTDSQLSALYKGTTLPLMHFGWHLKPNGAPDEIVTRMAMDFNLPIEGEKDTKPQRRAKGRFIFHDHLRLALRGGLKFGHAYFEQVGFIDKDGLWSLRKLAERPPQTIYMIGVDSQGGLLYITQNISGAWGGVPIQMPTIPVDRLVAYIWEQEDGSWVGRSAFRDTYKNWLLKDRLMRIDVINHERAGGVPWATAPPGASAAEVDKLHQLARDFKIGENSGGAVPYGAKVDIARAAQTDVVASIRYHDEAMARQWLLMMMQLGQTTTGSRALGRTFHDFFGQGQAAIADWFCNIFNEHVIEDYVDWNWGPEEDLVPKLGYEQNIDLAINDLYQLIMSGAIVVDRDMEDALRKEVGLPNKQPGSPDPVPLAQRAIAPGISGPGHGTPGASEENPQHPPQEPGTTKQGTGQQ